MFNQGVIGWFLSYKQTAGGEPPVIASYVTASHTGAVSNTTGAFFNNFPSTGDNRYIVVCMTRYPKTAQVTMSYGGQPLERLAYANFYSTTTVETSIWGLSNPSASAGDVLDIRFSANVSELGVAAMLFNNVNTTNPVKTTVTNYSGTARTSVTNDLTGSVVGDMCVTALGHQTTNTWSSSIVGQIDVGNALISNNKASVRYGYRPAVEATSSIGWTGASTRVTQVGVLLRGISN